VLLRKIQESGNGKMPLGYLPVRTICRSNNLPFEQFGIHTTMNPTKNSPKAGGSQSGDPGRQIPTVDASFTGCSERSAPPTIPR
jgi:hypothetical protein